MGGWVVYSGRGLTEDAIGFSGSAQYLSKGKAQKVPTPPEAMTNGQRTAAAQATADDKYQRDRGYCRMRYQTKQTDNRNPRGYLPLYLELPASTV